MTHVAVVGAGWAGLAAAVRAVQAGHRVTLLEMAPLPGGRARSDDGGVGTDNGQHLLVGAYVRCLDLMRTVGVDPGAALHRLPLTLRFPDGSGLSLPVAATRAGQALGAARALVGARGWTWRDRLALVRGLAAWRRAGFACPPALTVDQLLRPWATPALRQRLLDPLCIAALNTPPATASGQVFLATLRDALFGAPDGASFLLPRVPLGALLPVPAVAWLRAHGADVRLRTRVTRLVPEEGPALPAATGAHARWRLHLGDDTATLAVDAVVLAASASEAARLVAPLDPDWAAVAAALPQEPIVTITWRATATLPPWPGATPILALEAGDPGDPLPPRGGRPAQFVFRFPGDALDPRERLVAVVSAASAALCAGQAALADAATAQLQEALARTAPTALVPTSLVLESVRADRRATFRCDAGLRRPAPQVAPGLRVAGDYVDSPWPATLESAVRSGEAAAAAL